jgi:hypothetical protein
LGPVHYAIFQNRPLGTTGSTEAENATDLINELKVLSVSQYFLDSFIKRAGVYNYTSLPGAYSRFLSLINTLTLISDLTGSVESVDRTRGLHPPFLPAQPYHHSMSLTGSLL